jgi:hypothetical protein
LDLVLALDLSLTRPTPQASDLGGLCRGGATLRLPTPSRERLQSEIPFDIKRTGNLHVFFGGLKPEHLNLESARTVRYPGQPILTTVICYRGEGEISARGIYCRTRNGNAIGANRAGLRMGEACQSDE